MEWLDGASDAALQVALRATGTNGSGNIVVLRAKRELDDVCRSLPDSLWKERESWLNLRALLELLTSSPYAATSIFDAALDRLQPSSDQHESLLVASLTMLYLHSTNLREPAPPTLLRSRAEQGFQQYPNNTIILGFFLESQKGQSVWGRVNLILGEAGCGLIEKGVYRVLAEVWAIGWQKGSWREDQERIRSRLSAAVETDR